MGNNLCSEERCFNHVTLGNHASIDLIKEEDESADDGGYIQTWTISYTIYESSCKLYLKKYVDDCEDVSHAILKLEDDICFGGGMHLWVRRVHTIFFDLQYKYDQNFVNVMSFKSNETFSREGYVTTRVFRYGRGGKRGIIVVEWKKRNREDKNLYAITVAHYYALSRENIYNQNNIDVGLSMIVNIHVINDSLSYTVKGPDRHPSSALFYMFEEVYRSGSWKLTSCPHCAGEAQEQSSEVKHKDNNNILRANLNSFPVENLFKSKSFEQDRTAHMENSRNYQSQPYDFYQPYTRSSPESRLIIRNLNFPASTPRDGPKGNRRLELIDNKDINGNGNGNRIEGDQKFKLSCPFKYVNNHKGKQNLM